MDTLKAFWRDESGPEMVEWAVVTLILLVATVAAVVALRDTLVDVYVRTFEKLGEPPPPNWP